METNNNNIKHFMIYFDITDNHFDVVAYNLHRSMIKGSSFSSSSKNKLCIENFFVIRETNTEFKGP